MTTTDQKKPLPIWIQIMLGAIASSLEQAAEPLLVGLLQKQHDADKELYEAMLKSGHAFITPLTKLVAKTPTLLDDGVVLSLAQAIKDSAAANGVVLTD